MAAFTAEMDADGDQTVIRLAGDFDIEAAPDLILLATRAVTRPEMRSLIIDMSGVGFMDSTGIAALVRAHHLCDSHGAEIHLRGVSVRVYKVLDITGLTDWFGLPDGDSGRC
jgi:anti-sigma B factor antagonist